MEAMAGAAQSAGSASLLLSIVLSLVAQRALKFIFVFFVALQVAILFSRNTNYQPPASAKMFLDALLDIINLT